MRNVCLTLLLLPSLGFGAELVIHRCTQEDGTIAFQEIPCAEPADDSDTPSDSENAAPEDSFSDFVNPFDEPQEAPTDSVSPPLTPSPDRAECEKTTRDKIDAIDLKMREGYTKEEGQRYLKELLELTRQLRACKQSIH